MHNKIGVFDSGIGGVTVLAEIIKLLPNYEYVYYSDSKNNPYGNIDDEKLFNITCNIMDYFISIGCVAVVIACNTASTKCSKRLKERYKNIIIVSIVPAYKMVHDYMIEANTLIMATHGTVTSERFKKLYNMYDNHKTTVLECRDLAYKIENNTNDLDEYLKVLLGEYKNKVNAVVLGCTHYPLIKDKITNILGDVKFFDGAIGCSKQLKRLLEDNNLLNNNDKLIIKFIDSSNSKIKEKRFYDFINN